MASLTNPLLLAPIVIPTTGVYLDVDGSDITLTAGEYYWAFDETVSGSFNEHLADRLAADYGGAWTVDITSDFELGIVYSGGSVPTTMTFTDANVLDATDLGASATADTLTLTMTAGKYTSTYQPRWLWRANEWALDDQSPPWRVTTVAKSLFTRKSVTDIYGNGRMRMVRCEAVDGARVYQWAVGDSQFASAAGLQQNEPWASLEAMWLDSSRIEMLSGRTAVLQYVADEEAFLDGTESRVDVEWTDEDYSEEMAPDLLSEGPLLYTVVLNMTEV